MDTLTLSLVALGLEFSQGSLPIGVYHSSGNTKIIVSNDDTINPPVKNDDDTVTYSLKNPESFDFADFLKTFTCNNSYDYEGVTVKLVG